MSIEITTQLIHASYASVIRTIDENANIYDNPNQQGTYYPAWFLVHRSPVELQKGIGRWTLVYQIDIWYMLKSNQTRLYDQYSAIAEQLDDKLEYLPIFGTDACVHVLDRSWGLELDALKYSTTLRLYASRGPKPVIPYMEVIEDLRVFLKNQGQPEFYTLSFTNTDHPDFTVELPDDIVVSANAFVKLPFVSGKHTEDEETWVTSRWDIGEFGSSVKMDEDKVANLLWEELQQFVVSFANTTYPQFNVDLPEQAVVIAGGSITLPSVSGQFVEDGYVYTPSGWDIGDFGSEFTPTGNTIANLIFNAEKQYEEITLYIQSGNKNIQTRVTSRFTGDVNSSFVYQLYKDENLTIPWSGYDYSNDYQVGYIGTLDGEWHRRIDNIGDMPDTTVSEGVTLAFVLLDNSKIWLCCNSSSGLTSSPVSGVIVLRIYPKGQQYYAAYAYGSSTYANAYIGISSSKMCTKGPGSLQYIQTPHQFPHITLQKVLGAAGNEIIATTFVTGQGADDTRFHVINSGTREANIRTVIFTLEYPVIGYWLRPEGTNISTLSGVAYPLMNIGGEIIEIDNNFEYFPIALIQHNGNYATQTYSYLNNATMGAFDPEHPTWLCFKQVSGTLSLSYVQYYKKPKS